MRRILVVDDDFHIRLAIRAWLKHFGFRDAMADGGTNGLAALSGSQDGPIRSNEPREGVLTG
jgi:CheY-like chemotaxis protein